MPEKKKKNETKVEEDIFEGEEDLEPTAADLEGGEVSDVEELTLGEDTGEAEVTEEEAEEAVAGEEGKQQITVSFAEAPDFEGLNPGDEIDLITTYRVVRKTDTGVDVETVDFMPVEEMEEPVEPGTEMPPAAPPAGGGLPGGGGLAGLV